MPLIGISRVVITKKKEYQNALRYYNIVIDDYPGEAHGQIGEIYDTLERYSEAVMYFEEGVKYGDVYSMELLGSYYLHGIYVREDHYRAYEILYKAYQKGSFFGKEVVGSMKLHGDGTSQDIIGGFSLIRDCYLNHKYEENPDAYSHAVIEMGDCYLNGWGVPKNPQKAFEIYKAAREYRENRDYAEYKIALCYYNGDGVEINYLQASIHADIAYQIKKDPDYKQLSKDAMRAYHR